MTATVHSEDFHCSICLDLFKDPVTTPCGHTFCNTCITDNWNVNISYLCPLCKESFYSKPSLKTNTLILEMVAKIQSSLKALAGAGDVSCDVCPEPKKLKALKSCLDCGASYCQSHLEGHHTVPGLKRHELIGPVHNLQERVCSKHDQPLKMFCQTDQSYLCVTCSVSDHSNHKIVTLQEECKNKKFSLVATYQKIQNLVKQRWEKIQEIQCHMEFSERVSVGEIDGAQQTITALIEFVNGSLNQFIEAIYKNQRQTSKQAQDLVQKLQQEITELEKRNTEVEKLLASEDYFHLLHNCSSLPSVPIVMDCSSLSLKVESSKGKAAQLLSELKELISVQINRNILERVQQFEVDVTLDPNTAHANLTLSDDLKQVHHTDERKTCSDNTERFSHCTGVLGKQTITSNGFYFQVQVSGKTEWDIGVALESVSRKGSVHLNPVNGYWSIGMRGESKYYACTGARLLLKSAPLKVGVFVDYQKGQVDFYDVHTADLIHSFSSCNFTQKLQPFLSPGYSHSGINSSPLVLMSVEDLCSLPKKRKQ
ncbi:hypothetical protein WMY93_022303 [Mugilogobius chulae]|uniref:Uncharacterized protein n=1 Tax=Mugilogobius chulae TaxID=88201 RepID=A0AAW0NDN2_9GOBI